MVALYGLTSTAIWYQSRSTSRSFAVLSLKTEAEAIASYLASSRRIDPPELAEPEHSALPLWIRILEEGQVVGATPGIPDLPVAAGLPDLRSTDQVRYLESPMPLAVVQHEVGGRRPGMIVEAVGSLVDLRRRERKLGLGLLLGGLAVLPLAGLGGRWLAGRTLRSLDSLVGSIRRIESGSPGSRLTLPPSSFEEVAIVANAFNDLLERLQATLEGMRRFTADASHEIRNPLSVLRTGLEVALRRPRAPEEYQLLLRQNLREIERLDAVVEGLLALARQEPGSGVALARAPLDFSGLLTQTLESFAVVAAERGVTLDGGIPRGLRVEGDERLLRLVTFNLLDNALKHSPEGSSVRLRLTSVEGQLALRVSDQGPGVPEDERPRLFDRYFRGRDASTRGGTGGLGLSVVRWVVEAHGGTVRLVPDPPGTTFEVLLPALV